MSDEEAEELREEVKSLRRIIAETEADRDAAYDRIAWLEAQLAQLRGTLAQPDPETPPQITHDIPPNAPR